jgi:hypothetical protein
MIWVCKCKLVSSFSFSCQKENEAKEKIPNAFGTGTDKSNRSARFVGLYAGYVNVWAIAMANGSGNGLVRSYHVNP